MKKVQKISTQTITTLAQKDYESYKKNQKSFELLNWLKEEMILCQVNKIETLELEPKALSKVISILGYLQERNLNKCDIQILDSKTTKINFKFDLTTLSNTEKYILNQKYDLNLELDTEEEKDETYEHMI